MKEKEPKYPEITVPLVGMDGNAFMIMARISSALRKAGVSKEEIYDYRRESKSGDYDHLIQTALRWVNCE